jgi:hypothetical protein
MRLILIGCEYAGTTTVANAIHKWAKETLHVDLGSIHDHWKIPHTVGHPSTLTDEEQAQYLALSTEIKEAVQRHNLYYHTPSEGDGADTIIVGYYIEDTIYAQLYYGYGGDGEAGDRSVHSKVIEHKVLKYTPETVLILVKATPEIIARRMKEHPHKPTVIKEQDIPLVLRRFEEEFSRSGIRKRLVLDTSTATVEETLAEFAKKIQPYLTQNDRLRLLTAHSL